MTAKPIYLSNRPHYQLEEVARAIADLYPDKPNDAKGIDCISKKVLAPPRLRFKSGSASKPQYLYVAKSLSQKADLTKEDHETLGLLLAGLPEISHFMSTNDIELFFDKYYEIQNRPSWEPDLTSPADRERMKAAYDKRVTGHCKHFLSKVTEGKFSAFDKNFTILSGKEFNAQQISFVTKGDVIDYFKLLNLELIFENTDYSGISSLGQKIPIGEDVNITLPSMPMDSKRPAKRSEKRDLLTQAIEDYQKTSGTSWTPESMWNHFLKMAQTGEHPFIEESDDRIYLKGSMGGKLGFNLKALKGRLRTQKIAAKKLSNEVCHDIQTDSPPV